MKVDITVKQVIVFLQCEPIPKQLFLTECATAFLFAQERAQETHKGWWEKWMNGGYMKVVLKCSNQEKFDEIFSKVVENHLPFATTLNGRILAIGCAPSNEIDKLTSELKLL